MIAKALAGPDHDAIGPDSDPNEEYDAMLNKIPDMKPKVADEVDVNEGNPKVKDQSFMPPNSNCSGGKADIGKRSHSLAGVLPEDAYEEVEEGAGCPCCGDGPCNCASDCEGCDCGSMEEAIGDGFLSGNPSLADLLMQLDEMLDQVTEYRNNQQKASREESVQETVTNETIEMLRKLAGL